MQMNLSKKKRGTKMEKWGSFSFQNSQGRQGSGFLTCICFALIIGCFLFLNGMSAEAYNYVVNQSGVSPVKNDLWDIANGNQVTGFSDSFYGITDIGKSEIEEMFGGYRGDHSYPEPGIALFSDNFGAGTVHWVTWKTQTPIVLTSFNLFAAHDSNGRNINFRGLRTFNLYYRGANNWNNIFGYTHDGNTYGGGTNGNELILQVTGLNVIAQEFKAEFVQAGGPDPNALGPRIIELDGFGRAVPLPSTILLLLPGFAGIIGLRKVLK